MNDSGTIILVLSWTCVLVFIATSIISILALLKKISLPNDSYLKKLFYLLIIEVVGIGVLGFKMKITSGNEQEFIVITGPTSNINYLDDWDHINFQGAFNSSKENPQLLGYYKIDGSEPISLTEFKTTKRNVFNVDLPYIPLKKEKLKVVIFLSQNIKDSVEIIIEP